MTIGGKDLGVPTTSILTQIVVPVPASYIPAAGTYPVTVRNPDGTSNAATNFTAT